jgi:hypothetical protein
LGDSEHGLGSHAEKLDNGAACEQQKPAYDCELPSEFVDDQRRDSEEDGNEDWHSTAIVIETCARQPKRGWTDKGASERARIICS